MARQGSLRQRISRPRCAVQAIWKRCAQVCLLLGCWISSTATGVGAAELPPIDIRVVFEFAAAKAQPWDLHLRLEDSSQPSASLGEIRNYSRSATTSGMFNLDRNGTVLMIRSRHEIHEGKFELRIRCSREAKLWVEPHSQPAGETRTAQAREISVVELLGSEPIESQTTGNEGEEACGWTIVRAEGDWLRIDERPGAPVYRAGEELNLATQSNGMVEHASQSCQLSYELYRVSGGEVVATHRWPIQVDAWGNSPSVRINEPVPAAPGVYEVRLQLDPSEEHIWSRLRRRPPTIARATHPIVVVAGSGETAGEAESWREIGVIRPSESSWSVGQWLPSSTARLLPGTGELPPPELASESHAGKTVSLLAPMGTFQATLPVRTPGYPHQITIRLPSNSSVDLRVQVGPNQEHCATNFVLQGDSTADQRGPWREHTFLHHAAEGDQVWLTNIDAGKPAAFESIAVQAGPARLATKPDAGPSSRTAALRLSDLEWTNRWTEDIGRRGNLATCAPSTVELHRLVIAAERVQDYAHACGFNGIVVPANDSTRAWYGSAMVQASEEADVDRRQHLETVLRLLESSRLDLYVGLMPNMLLSELERSIHDNTSQLVELTRNDLTVVPPRTDAAAMSNVQARTCYNPLHGLVQVALAGVVKELNDRCSQYPRYSGLLVDCGGNSHLTPLNDEMDPGSILLFARAHGMTGSVPQLRNTIQSQGSDAFEQWGQQQHQHAHQMISRTAPEGRIRFLMSQATPYRGADKSAGTNMTRSDPASTDSENSAVGAFHYGPAGVLARDSSMQHQLTSLSGRLPATLFGVETQTGALMLIREQLIGDLSRLIDRADPALLIVELDLLASQLNPDLEGTIRSFRALPSEAMKESTPIDSASHTVHLRSGNSNGHLYVSMIGVVPWASDVDLEMIAPTQWEIIGRIEGESTDKLIQSSAGTRTRVTVPAGQMVVMRSKEPSSTSIRSWTTRVSGGPEAIESLKHKITLIVERIGNLNEVKPYGKLSNGGFEQSGGMGLVGWMHAQHPPGCVQVDSQEFVEGSHSVLLTTGTPAVARTWLVSETIAPPASGRLAVSLACRAESSADMTPHSLRVSIEATRRGEPVRFTRDLEIPRNGEWSLRDTVLEVDQLDTASIDSLRLTIDSLASGRVWIDDVQLHDRFPTAKERADLQGQVFLAVQGLQRGNLLPSGKLLQNHWARHLLTLGPAEQTRRVMEPAPGPLESPGMAERIRSWLPRQLRF